MKNLIKSCIIKTAIFIFLILIIIFLVSCSKPVEQEAPSGQILYYEIDNPPNTMWRTYTIEEQPIDLFEKWQQRQPNQLAQREWDAYMENDNS